MPPGSGIDRNAMTTARTTTEMAIYVCLALAGLTVAGARLWQVLWIFGAGLAVKTYIAWLQAKRG